MKFTTHWPGLVVPLLTVLLTGCSETETERPAAQTAISTAGSAAMVPAQAETGQPTGPPVTSPQAGQADPPPLETARKLLGASEPRNSYTSLPEPVWRARTALTVALADTPLPALDEVLEQAKEQYSGFGAVTKLAQVAAQIAVVAHHLDMAELESAALARIDTLAKGAFDREEAEGVRAVQLQTLARMARKPGSDRADEFAALFETMLSTDDAEPLVAWADLLEYYYHDPAPRALARMVVEGRAEMDAVKISGRPSTVRVVQRLAWWRSWQAMADIVAAFAGERLVPWQALARWAVEAELDGDQAIADRLAELAEARHRALNRSADVAADAEAVSWMRAHLDVADADQAKAMFNDNPDATATRREPGTTTLGHYKREVIAAAMIRAGFTDRGYQVVGGGRAQFAMPALVFSAYAEAGMWDALLHLDPRWGMAKQLFVYGMSAETTGWPDLAVAMSRKARESGQNDAAQRALLSAIGVEPHPGNRAVAEEIIRQLGNGDALAAAMDKHQHNIGGTRASFQMINLLVRGGVDVEQVMRAMGLIHLANRTLTWETLHLLPEFGTALAYGAAGLPKLWW